MTLIWEILNEKGQETPCRLSLALEERFQPLAAPAPRFQRFGPGQFQNESVVPGSLNAMVIRPRFRESYSVAPVPQDLCLLLTREPLSQEDSGDPGPDFSLEELLQIGDSIASDDLKRKPLLAFLQSFANRLGLRFPGDAADFFSQALRLAILDGKRHLVSKRAPWPPR